MTPDALLALYDREVRGSFLDRLPAGWVGSEDGPLVRALFPRAGFAMLTRSADDLAVGDLRALVDRTIMHFAQAGHWFEWKTFDHDTDGLVALLLAAGAEAEEHEALLLGDASRLAAEPVLPPGLTMREVTEGADLERIAAMESAVWGEDWSWLAADLEARLADPTQPARIFVVEDAETDDGVVSAAWLVPLVGTSVAGLWGGSTLAAYRGRGIYRALVARRAQLAVDLGYPVLQVDASDDSRPILEHLGLHVVGGTTPYVLGRDADAQADD
jgi:GNAT superfamily N-acetyltransferase